MTEKIKVVAPRNNPHICYIPKEWASKIQAIKISSGLSLYQILSLNANQPLDTTEHIKEFKKSIQKKGYKTIGDWAVVVINTMYDQIKKINE